MIEVKKVWGVERWLINCDKYCSKFLFLNKGATSSYHYHKEKQETFYVLMGKVLLTVEGKDYEMNPLTGVITIEPNEKHKFFGIADSTILEVSTHHDDEDVYRLEESRVGMVFTG